MKMRSVMPMRIAKTGYIVISVLLCVVGIAFIAVPNISTEIIGICIGIAMILFGAVKLVGYFSKDLFRLAFQFDLELGVLLAVLGVVVLFNPKDLMEFICIAIGISILLDGLYKIRIAMDSKRFGIKSWWVILAMAAVTGVIGIFLIFNSAVGSQLLSILLGATLLAEGILNLYTVISTVLIVKNQAPDVIEAEAFEIYGKDE